MHLARSVVFDFLMIDCKRDLLETSESPRDCKNNVVHTLEISAGACHVIRHSTTPTYHSVACEFSQGSSISGIGSRDVL